MPVVYFSPTTLGLYPAAWKEDGTYTDTNWPQDAVLLTDDQSEPYFRQSPPPGKIIGSVNGLPGWIDPPPLSTDDLTAQMRARRDGLIAETDYLLMSDYPIATAQLDPMKVYRQALRDITIQSGFPQTINWPVKPT